MNEKKRFRKLHGYSYCAFCGMRFRNSLPSLKDALAKHAVCCSVHPLHGIVREAEELRKIRDGLMKDLMNLSQRVVDVLAPYAGQAPDAVKLRKDAQEIIDCIGLAELKIK
jgi:hypothetical protein